MPELPEAEITKRKLSVLEGKTIAGFWCDWPRALRIVKSAARINRDIKGFKISKLRRRGKAIFIDLSGKGEKRLLAFHQRMSGKLIISSKSDNQNIKKSHIRAKLFFTDGMELLFIDPRKFGIVWYGSAEKVMRDSYLASLGPDMLSLSLTGFKNRLNKKGMVKPVLLRQDVVAGIGNIIADESLWRSKIHPTRQACGLSDKEITKLYDSIKQVIALGIKKGGTSMRDWGHPDGNKGRFQENFKVYARKGGLCYDCKSGKIKRILVGGRGSWICPKCQSIIY